jgi:hypothetical protein
MRSSEYMVRLALSALRPGDPLPGGKEVIDTSDLWQMLEMVATLLELLTEVGEQSGVPDSVIANARSQMEHIRAMIAAESEEKL